MITLQDVERRFQATGLPENIEVVANENDMLFPGAWTLLSEQVHLFRPNPEGEDVYDFDKPLGPYIFGMPFSHEKLSGKMTYAGLVKHKSEKGFELGIRKAYSRSFTHKKVIYCYITDKIHLVTQKRLMNKIEKGV